MPKTRNGLTKKQKEFADYYLELGNGSEAAIRAGYSKRSSRTIATENLKKPAVIEYVNKKIAEKDALKVAKQDEILEFLTKVMRGEVQEDAPLLNEFGSQDLVPKGMSAKDRVKAAELLGKRYMLWIEKQQIEANVSATIVDDVDDLEDDIDDN